MKLEKTDTEIMEQIIAEIERKNPGHKLSEDQKQFFIRFANTLGKALENK
jgi:hypothetical protein